MDEVVAFEEKRFSRRRGQRVREAVAVIQAGAVAPLAKAAERTYCHFAVVWVDRDEFDARSPDEVIQIAQPFSAMPCLDDKGDLDERRDRHQPGIAGLDGFDEGTAFGFTLQDGQERRGIYDHLPRHTVLVVTEYLVRRSGVEDGEVGAVLGPYAAIIEASESS